MKKYTLYFLALTLLAAGIYAALRTGTASRLYPSVFRAPDRAGEMRARSVNEYHYNYKNETGLPLFSWVYAGFLTDEKGGLYQFSCTYYSEESTYYSGFLVLLKKLNKDRTGGKILYKFSWKEGVPRFTESAGSVRITRSEERRVG